jgi:hypothetical protein
MEWVFFVTKPSFMSGMSLWVQSRIFILSSLGWAILPLLLILLFGIIARVVHREPVTQFLVAAVIMIPSLIVSSLILLLVDNFTYTVLQFGIVSTERLSRAAYGFLFLLLCGFAYPMARWKKTSGKTKPVDPAHWVIVPIRDSIPVLNDDQSHCLDSVCDCFPKR